METGRTNEALACVISTAVTNFQNVLPNSVETSLSTLSNIRHSVISSEEITAF